MGNGSCRVRVLAWGLTAVGVATVVAVPGAAVASPGAPGSANARTPARPSYTVALASDPQGFNWRGTESVSFTNASSSALSSVWIRLWDNGIEGCQPSLPISVSNVVGGTAGSLSVNCTALPVTLPAPLGEGETATLSFDLSIAVPDRNDRFGRIGSMALLGNALPVLAIHDGRGWHLDPYVSFGEAFYSQVGDFTVTLDAPAALSLPATGEATGVRAHGARVATTFVATDVRDFAWASGPLQEIDGPASTGVTVRVWWPGGISLGQAQDALAVGEEAIASHASKYGTYLYPEVDVVLGLFTAFGGMEYPQFVMAVPNDGVIVHELGHQWWYGMVGDDEYNEPWLDEAFATYVTDVFYADQGAACAGIHFPSATARVSNSMAYFTQHVSEYFVVVYSIGSCALHDLSKTLGRRVMTRFLRSYGVGHALGWSTTAVFMSAAQKVASELPTPVDLTPLWHRWRIGPP